MKNGWGGKRPGAGMPKGYKTKKTLLKEQAREEHRRQVTAAIYPMTQRHIANAMGIGHVYVRDKAGKFNKIEDPQHVDELLASGEEGKTYWIFTKDPSVQGYVALLNYALDKPAEQLKVTGAEGGPVEMVFKWER